MMYTFTSTDDSVIQQKKQRITFYASKIEREIIEQVRLERNDMRIGNSISQIILEYGVLKEFSRMKNELEGKLIPLLAEIEQLKSENEILRDRLEIVEAKYAMLNRTVSKRQAGCTKDKRR